MARPFRKTPRVQLAARAATIGAALVAVFGLVSTGGVAEASAQNYSAVVGAQGLDLNLFGQQLSGGFANACVNSGTSTGISTTPQNHCNGVAAPEAWGQGEGILLTTSGLHSISSAEATETHPVASDPAGSTAPTTDSPAKKLNCSPLSSGGPQGSNGVTLDLGVACSSAQAIVDPAASAPLTADGYGEVAHLNVDLNGILGAILGASPSSGSANQCDQQTSNKSPIGALLGGVCQILNSVAGGAGAAGSTGTSLIQGIDEALQKLGNVASKDLGDTVTVAVGPAVAQIDQHADGTVTSYGSGATLDVGLLDGVGCTAGTALLTCATNAAAALAAGNLQADPTGAPLVEVKVGPATCTETRDPATGNWTAVTKSAVATVDLNIPGDNISIPILQNEGVSQTILAGTPLQTTIKLAAETSAPVGDASSCSGQSVTVSALENPSFPGGSSTPGTGGAIFANLGGVTGAVSSNGAPPTSPNGNPPAVQTASGGASPTSVHTGEWWAGSLPLIAAIAALGAAMIGWPRLRRFAPISRVIHRGGR